MLPCFHRLDPSNAKQWYIIEVQGDFKTKTDGVSLNGHLVGDLLFTKKVRKCNFITCAGCVYIIDVAGT